MLGDTRAGAGGVAVVVGDGDTACRPPWWQGGPAVAVDGCSERLLGLPQGATSEWLIYAHVITSYSTLKFSNSFSWLSIQCIVP